MDRQDIDALLIGALYGELTPADEARLATHLDSHPTDRGALDDLKVARQAVHESRIFAVQLEPPQAVSALLLQEAHRRAPKRVVVAEEKESWFYRFTRSFMAHPAMAAAAMLVLVLGGAGIVYMKKGDQFVERQVSATHESAPSAADIAVTTAPMAPAAEAAQGSAALADGSAYSAGLYEADKDKADEAAPADMKSASDRWEGQAQLGAERAALSKNKKPAPSRGIVVGTEKGAVKEMERAKSAKAGGYADTLGFDSAGGRAPGGGGGASGAATISRTDTGADSNYAQPPPPPAAATPSAPSKVSSTTSAPRAEPKPEPRVTTTAKPSDAPKQEATKDSSLIAWAKGEHSRATALAQKGECALAAKIALNVSTRASDYYSQFMATDRALKQCAQYINAERDREAERSGKARAQKRVNADEPAPTTTVK